MPDYRRSAPPILYRITFGYDPIALRDWNAATVTDRMNTSTFGHRWDDPNRQYRCLYASSTPTGAIVEVTQDLRPSQTELERLEAIELEPGEALPPLRTVPAKFFDSLIVAKLRIGKQNRPFLEMLHADVISSMREKVGPLATYLGLTVSAAEVLGPNRELTQAMAREAFKSGYAGIVAPSSLGLPLQGWTLFETGENTNRFHVELAVERTTVLAITDPDVIEALTMLHLRIDDERQLRVEPHDLDPADLGL